MQLNLSKKKKPNILKMNYNKLENKKSTVGDTKKAEKTKSKISKNVKTAKSRA